MWSNARKVNLFDESNKIEDKEGKEEEATGDQDDEAHCKATHKVATTLKQVPPSLNQFRVSHWHISMIL